MKDKRKEIIRDLLGDFAEDSGEEEESTENDEVEKSKKSNFGLDDEEAFKLNKIMKKPAKRSKKVKKVKKVSDVMKAEIIEE